MQDTFPADGVDVRQFEFELPNKLIAQHPTDVRSDSRLLVVGQSPESHLDLKFSQLSQLLKPQDLLVCNDSRVIRARLNARKLSGGQVEMLIERIEPHGRVLVQLKSRRQVPVASSIVVNDKFEFRVIARKSNLFVLQATSDVDVESVVSNCGSVPLPPYIRRPVDEQDRERYQTIYARRDGSVAAPTAGLHFDTTLLEKIRHKGCAVEFVTLHVGAGTFSPVRGDDLNRHQLHSEQCELSAKVCEAVSRAKECGGRVIAVGTTTARVLESAASSNDLRPFCGQTDLFIKPGFEFKIVDALITNFHLPRSTLLALVCAFGGTQRILNAYRHAVENEFRFYSYGDAMFIEPIAPSSAT